MTMARKPCMEPTVAQNAVRWGTGGMNLGACRVGVGERVQAAAGSPGFGVGRDDNYELGTGAEFHTNGRWPANLILMHKPGCRKTGTKTILSQSRGTERTTSEMGYSGGWRKSDRIIGYADENGEEIIDAWECVEGCPVADLDDQSGLLTSGLMRAGTQPKGERYVFGQDGSRGYTTTRDTPGDSGGASRFFKQVQREAE